MFQEKGFKLIAASRSVKVCVFFIYLCAVIVVNRVKERLIQGLNRHFLRLKRGKIRGLQLLISKQR